MNRKVAGVAESQPQVAGRTRLVLGCLLIVAVLAVVVPVYYWLTTDPPSTGVCSVDLSIPLRGRVQPNGSIVDQGEVFPKGYHFQKNGTTLGCLCALKSCIRKCCPLDETFFSPNGRSSFDCVKIPSASQFFKFSSVVHNSAVEMVNVTKNHFGVLFGDACHHGKFWLDPSASPADKTYLMMDGRILLYGRNHEEIYFDASKYCLESVNGSEVIYTFLCVQPVEDAQTKAKYIFYPIGMLLSIPFLFATFIVYAIIPDLHGNPHGKSIMSHILSLLTGYVTLTVIQLMGKNMPGFWCFSLAFVIQFSFLATFFWLNVMCFDIWWVFSGLRPLRGSVKEREHKKFILYSLYAWGCPLVIFVITLVIELVPSIPKSFIKPQFGVDKCWFKTSEALVLYFYLPIGVLVLLNIAMFVTTAFRLRMHTRDTKVLQTSESRRNDEAERQRFNLYLKLFIVMGINWVMELVSFVVGGPKSIWFVTDLGNTLQGLLIFLIFVCKRRILRLLNQKLCPRWELVAPTASSRSKTEKQESAKTNSTKSTK
ncbi:G-protein coupled receptor Mth2-like isoform X3 [Homalodisca vitripennis]|uniref:G-protein coupled receptor Mth2-like isoform X3 n=1 Tax=Homalodisca vitripennis TaxID=197043 RepID=UPI001EE9D415|nr:G-protein coupled receptor Mth2-like isoform X3 [Homalodisca vitripennis]XP_046680951.1 G-protein coupled receptor Mth2-like isoform X3 [Homalodisca vitripennis]